MLKTRYSSLKPRYLLQTTLPTTNHATYYK